MSRVRWRISSDATRFGPLLPGVCLWRSSSHHESDSCCSKQSGASFCVVSVVVDYLPQPSPLSLQHDLMSMSFLYRMQFSTPLSITEYSHGL